VLDALSLYDFGLDLAVEATCFGLGLAAPKSRMRKLAHLHLH
jgi:hypothetical protein